MTARIAGWAALRRWRFYLTGHLRLYRLLRRLRVEGQVEVFEDLLRPLIDRALRHKEAPLFNAPVVYSDDPFGLSNGYRMSRPSTTGADGRMYEFGDCEGLEAWEQPQLRPAE